MSSDGVSRRSRSLPLAALVGAAALLSWLPATAAGQDRAPDPQSLREALWSGELETCIEGATQWVNEDPWEPAGWELLLAALRSRGEYGAAAGVAERALARMPGDGSVALEAAEVFQRAGDPDRAREILELVDRRALASPRRYSSPRDRVALARIRLRRGADARTVLNQLLRPARRDDPELVEASVAIARLALDKFDDALAATEVQAALELRPQDPELHLLKARAFAASDPEVTERSLGRALELNPRHVGSLLFRAENMLNAEEADRADAVLREVLEIEPGRWEAWAYRAALAELQGAERVASARRAAALTPWERNPGVDHLIGSVLSRNYRFVEGAAHQRLALALEPQHRDARFDLALDLLRLGQEQEGWALAESVLDDDPYHVVAFNLSTLRDQLDGYSTLRDEHFVLRMEAREAAVYGPRVLRLLQRARQTLAPRYGVVLDRPVLVELFAEQKDFAIRTFGLPGGAGFLGVCFGDVVTMNSPASQGETPSNWEAVLWHEFCHVLTLKKTANKMPRWLSEGISVHEERRADPRWGQSMTPLYREWVLAGRSTPISGLSGAFLRPRGPMGLQFAYYQSSMVVEYLEATVGHEVLLEILDDLAGATSIHESLARRVAPAEQLDADFDAWFRERALAYGPDLEWDVDPSLRPGPDQPEALLAWAREHPGDLPGLLAAAAVLEEGQRDDEALALYRRARTLLPGFVEAGNAYEGLTRIHRRRGDETAEGEALRQWVDRDADALPARLRLLELSEDPEQRTAVLEDTLAVQPLLPQVQRARLAAARERGDAEEVWEAGEALLALDPLDPAQVHFERARAAEALGDPVRARSEVLRCLEEAPRFREALELLLRVVDPARDDS